MRQKLSKKDLENISIFIKLRKRLFKTIKSVIDANGLDYMNMEIVKNCYVIKKDVDSILYQGEEELGTDADNYFVNRTQLGDDWYTGYIYIPTQEKGTYIQIHFECY